MREFVYEALPNRVIFGHGTLKQLPDELRNAGAKRVLVLSTPEQANSAEALFASLGDLSAGTFTQAKMHTPVEVTEQAVQAAAELKADAVVSFGGGSTTGLGKAIALRNGLLQIAIPTTYAGSEVTPILGETKAGEKVTMRSLKVLPKIVIYDVDLTLGLPKSLTVTSGINAIAHAAEALYAKDKNPLISLLAEDGIRAFAKALPILANAPDNLAARSDALYGAWACGTCLAAVGMALHHKICHTLGGTFNLPHAETHSVILPHALAYNAAAAPEAMERIARVLGAANAPDAIYDLLLTLGAPTSLKGLGMPEDGIARAADLAVANPYWNPRPLDREGLLNLLASAYRGSRPEQY